MMGMLTNPYYWGWVCLCFVVSYALGWLYKNRGKK